MESVLYGKTPLELINAENNSGYINVSVTFKMLSEQKNKQKGKWVDDIIETKKAFDTLESRNTKTKGLDLDINVLNYFKHTSLKYQNVIQQPSQTFNWAKFFCFVKTYVYSYLQVFATT